MAFLLKLFNQYCQLSINFFFIIFFNDTKKLHSLAGPVTAVGKTIMHLRVLYKSGNFFSGRVTVFFSRTVLGKGGWLRLVFRDMSEYFAHLVKQSHNYKRCNWIGQQLELLQYLQL